MAEPAAEATGDTGAAAAESLTQAGASLLHTLRAVAADFFELAATELRLAGLSFTAMLVMGIAAAVLGVTAWLLIMGAIAAHWAAPGTGWGTALAIIALCNLGGAAGLIVLIRRRSQDLLFSRSRRQLTPAP